MEEGEGEQIETAPWGGEYPQEATEDGAPAPEWTTVSSETGEPYDANAVLVESSWASPDSLQQEQENDWAEAPSLQYGNQRNGDGTLNQNDDVDVSERADGQHLTLEEEIPVPAEERLNEDFTEESEELNLSLGQKDDVADQQGSFTSDDATDTRHTMGFINVATSPAVPEPANTFISTANGIEEVVEWLELLDPDQGALYYFAPHSGEIRWEAPTESTAYIRLCASGGELNKDIMFESAATSHETGVPIALIKDQNMQPEGARNVGDEGNLVSNEGKSLLWENETKEEETLHPQVHEPQWVEVYDPVTQHQYYYSPRTNTTRWDVSELPGGFIDGSKAAAAISIQAMSRGHAARRQVQELREKKHQHKRLHPIQEISLIEADTEFEFEAVCRREMITEELLQLSRGDRFWGVDIHDSEVLQLHIEKELMAKGVSTISQEYPRVYTLQQPTPTIRSSYYLAFEEDDEKMDTERLQQALQEESDAREAMFREESKQCQNADTFWGIQAEELRQTAANISMALEEEASRRFAEDALDHALSTAWEAEIQQSIANEIATHGEQEQRMQGRYLSWFYGQCVSVDELLDYSWPTKTQQQRLEEMLSPEKIKHPAVVQVPLCSLWSATPFPLDNLVVQERLENGDLRYGLRSILTVHHQHLRGTNGTRFEITQASPECSFDEIAAAEMLKSGMAANFSDEKIQDGNDEARNEHQGRQNGLWRATTWRDGAPCSSVNYRRSGMPDPHIPARFNGVPYKPNQMSPTREILSSDHRKLNQLPSLVKSKLTAQAPKPRQLQKAKAKARAKAKSLYPPQSFTNGKNFVSDRDHESDDNEKQANDVAPADEFGFNGLHVQFIRQEYGVLSELFALMDVDGSGTVNQDEMQWALQRDEEINTLAKTSPLLKMLLKHRSRLESLFYSTDTATQSGDSNSELSLEEFLARSEHCHAQLVAEGLLQFDSDFAAVCSHPESDSIENRLGTVCSASSYQSEKEIETITIRRVFALLDIDQNGILDVAEVREALYDSAVATPKSSVRAKGSSEISKELHVLVKNSRALQPMLHQELFMSAFDKFEPLNPHGICEEEFVAFCLEIAQVAAANNMT